MEWIIAYQVWWLIGLVASALSGFYVGYQEITKAAEKEIENPLHAPVKFRMSEEGQKWILLACYLTSIFAILFVFSLILENQNNEPPPTPPIIQQQQDII